MARPRRKAPLKRRSRAPARTRRSAGSRPRALQDALEQQAATAEVLKAISAPAFDLQSVLDSMTATAARLCKASDSTILLLDGDDMVFGSHFGEIPVDFKSWKVSPNWTGGRAVLERKTVHVRDMQTERGGFPEGNVASSRMGYRTILTVPMMHGEEPIGALTLRRTEVRPFTAKQVSLAESFATQTVIAIQNARLLKELHARTDELHQLNEQLEKRVTDQVGEIERMGRLRRFLPPQVADLIVSSGGEKQLESHRREITALFCDLRGFTAFSESADPEDVMALLRDYHAAIGEIIFKHGGTLERFVGDGAMVIFNDPIPLPNHSLHAVQMALEMRASIDALVDTWRRLGYDIGFGIGIAHGYATLGTIGFEGRFDYAAIGTVSNLASRLCDEAKPGQILISARVLAAVKDTVAIEPAGEMALKGIRRPVEVYTVVGPAGAD
jgi:adenylate cyclase